MARLNGPTGGTERARLLAAAAAAGGDEPKDSGFGGDEDFSAGFGGVRKKHKLAGGDGVAVDPGATPFAIGGVASQEVVREARVERDPETGRIVRVIHDNGSGRAGSGGLDDPLNGLDSDESDEDEDHEKKETTAGAFQHPIVAQLEAQAAEVRPTKKRHQSQREREWLAKLVAKHGWGNEAAMARDRVLNPFQQTEADLRRRLKIWREQEGGEV